jgi:hypothetical protein
VSAEAGVAVLAVIFAAGVVGLALVMISLLPGLMLAESRLEALRNRRREAKAAGDLPNAPA